MTEQSRYGYLLVAIMMLAAASLGGVWSSTSLFMSTIIEELKINYVMAGGLIAVMMLPLVGFAGLLRKPLHRIGFKWGMNVGIAFIGVFGTISAYCPDYWSMLICRFLAALGLGILFMFHNLIIMSFFGATTEKATAGTLAVLAGLVLGAFSSTYYSSLLYFLFLGEKWRNVVAFWGFLGILATLLWAVFGKASPYD